MAVLVECLCHKKQSLRNKVCPCGEDLVKLKRANRANYWISYRLPGGKQRRELIGESIEEARDADGKRRVQKREHRIFDIKAETKMTFQELTDWYLGLEKVKALAYYPTLSICLNNFNSVFGSMPVSQIKPMDLENYQAKRKAEGRADHTIDQQIGAAKAMINKAFDNDIVSGDTLRTFKKVKKVGKRNANARKKILSFDQFKKLMECLPIHTKWILATGFFTGMRSREITSLTWDRVSLKDRTIQLDAKHTKDKEPRSIPICDDLYGILKGIPRAIHDDHVFLYRGYAGKKPGVPVKNIRRSLANACQKAKIPYGRFTKDGFIYHDLRHGFNTYMRKAGVPESVIMEITGHSTREMFDRYNTVDAEDRKQAVKVFEGFLHNESASVDQTVDQVAILGE
jgi:integrase